jgi:hypothetical protein
MSWKVEVVDGRPDGRDDYVLKLSMKDQTVAIVT